VVVWLDVGRARLGAEERLRELAGFAQLGERLLQVVVADV
jgi:hypothetical protein